MSVPVPKRWFVQPETPHESGVESALERLRKLRANRDWHVEKPLSQQQQSEFRKWCVAQVRRRIAQFMEPADPSTGATLERPSFWDWREFTIVVSIAMAALLGGYTLSLISKSRTLASAVVQAETPRTFHYDAPPYLRSLPATLAQDSARDALRNVVGDISGLTLVETMERGDRVTPFAREDAHLYRVAGDEDKHGYIIFVGATGTWRVDVVLSELHVICVVKQSPTGGEE